MMKMLSLDNIIHFHEKIIKTTGGSSGIRDKGLIESAANKVYLTFGGKDLYSTDIEKISAVTFSLISNHGFIDGNKRIGVAVMIILLKLNDINIFYTQKELIELGLKIASGVFDEKDINNWISQHTK